jgi:hypothetical protein
MNIVTYREEVEGWQDCWLVLTHPEQARAIARARVGLVFSKMVWNCKSIAVKLSEKDLCRWL